LPLLAAEVNVRDITVVAADTELVRLRPKANFRTLGKRYGKRTPEVAKAAERLSSEQLRGLEEGAPATLRLDDGTEVEYLPEDIAVERDVTSDWLVQSAGPFVAALDPALDDTLRREGLAREILNRVQRLRKEAGYEFTTRIELWIDGDADVRETARAHEGFIGSEGLATAVQVGARAAAADLEQEMIIDGHPLVVGVRRTGAAA